MGESKVNVLTPIRVKTKQKLFTYNEFAAEYEGKVGKHVLYGRNLVNCDCTGGKLRLMNMIDSCLSPNTGFAFQLQKTDEEPNALYELKRRKGDVEQRVVCFTLSNGDFYVAASSHTSVGKLYNVGKNCKGVFAYDEQNLQAIVFVGEEGAFMYSVEAGQWCTKKKLLPMGCFVKGRLFSATKQGQLVYFAPFAPRAYQDTMEDGGEVQLPQETGGIVDIAGVGDCVYVFCEHGILRLKAAASARDFSFESVPYNGGRILSGSARATMQNGGEVFFMTTDGLCTVQEKHVTHFGKKGKLLIGGNETSCRSWLVDCKYVVSVTDIYGQAHTYAIDLQTKQAYPFKTYACMTTGGGKTLMTIDRYVYYLRVHNGANATENMSFETLLDFGTNKQKLLKRLAFSGCEYCYGYVESSYGKRDFYARCGEGGADIHLKGSVFKLVIHNSKENCITGMSADVVTLQ